MFDLIIGGAVLVACLPLMIVVAAAIKICSPGPVFYRQTRTGKDAKFFKIYKFRSMAPPGLDEGPGLTSKNDPRLTTIGRWLRKLKLDELPQLFNVLRGEMSLVGPRPKLPRLELIDTGITLFKPGVTSPATITFRHEESLLRGLPAEDVERVYMETIAPVKAEIDVSYFSQATLLSDCRIIFATIEAIFTPDNQTARALQQPPGDEVLSSVGAADSRGS